MNADKASLVRTWKSMIETLPKASDDPELAHKMAGKVIALNRDEWWTSGDDASEPEICEAMELLLALEVPGTILPDYENPDFKQLKARLRSMPTEESVQCYDQRRLEHWDRVRELVDKLDMAR